MVAGCGVGPEVGVEGADVAAAVVAVDVLAVERAELAVTDEVASDHRAAGAVGIGVDREDGWPGARSAIVWRRDKLVALVLRPAEVGAAGAPERLVVDLLGR